MNAFLLLAGLGSNHCRIRNGGEANGLSRSEAKSGDCKVIANPALPTIIFQKAFITTMNAFLLLAGLGSNHCRIRNGGEANGLSRSEAKSGDCKVIANPALPTIIFQKAFITTMNAFLLLAGLGSNCMIPVLEDF